MKLQDALKDKTITHLRLPFWNETAVLELPPWIDENNCRGIWCNLIDCGKKIPMLIFQLNGDTDDRWEISQPKPWSESVHQWEL